MGLQQRRHRERSRATVPANTTLPAGQTYVFANSAGTFTAQGDVLYGTGITNTGGVQIRDARRRGPRRVRLHRRAGGLPRGRRPRAAVERRRRLRPQERRDQDTDDNVADFTGPLTPTPTKCGDDVRRPGRARRRASPARTASCRSRTSRRSATDRRATARRSRSTASSRASTTSTARTSTAIFKADSGIWIQEATRAPRRHDLERAVRRGHQREHDPPNPLKPAEIIGDEVTITGRVETKFGQVGIVPPGVGNTGSPLATGGRPTTRSSATEPGRSNPLPAPVDIDRAKAEAQGLDRTYYRSLQGMRVRLPEGIATGGGTTKFNDVFVEPGTTAQRLFRKNDPAANDTPWHDKPAEIGIAPDGGAGNPADPRLPWKSATQVDLDLFDIARNVVGPLSFGFSYYKIMPQLTGAPAPTIERGPINAAAPPTAPGAAGQHAARGELQRRELLPGREGERRPRGHAGRVQAERTDAIVTAIKDRLGAPDVVAVQEVAVFADGANALTGLAQALGNYTRLHHDQQRRPRDRDRLPGQGRHDGDQRPADRQHGPRHVVRRERVRPLRGGRVRPRPEQDGKLFDRAPYALDLKKGDLSFTAMSNHFASQSHQTQCRIDEAAYVRDAAGGDAAGRQERARGGRSQ